MLLFKEPGGNVASSKSIVFSTSKFPAKAGMRGESFGSDYVFRHQGEPILVGYRQLSYSANNCFVLCLYAKHQCKW